MKIMKEEVWKNTDCPFREYKCKMYECIAFTIADVGPQYTNADYTVAYCAALGSPNTRRY